MFLPLLLILFSFCQTAQASDLATQVEATYQGIKNLSVDFVQETQVPLMDMVLKKEGSFFLKAPDSFRISYQRPEKKEFISDGKILWVYRPDDKEVEVYQQAGEALDRESLLFLSGLEHLKKDYEIKTPTGDKAELFLIPKANSSFKKIHLRLDPYTHLLESLVLFPKNGNETHYRFFNYKLNEDFKKDFFQFKTPRGVKELKL